VPSQFDPAQLRHWQREAVIHSDAAALWDWVGKDVRRLVTEARRDAFVDAVRGNILLPKDALHWATILFHDPLALHDEARTIINGAGAGFYEHAVRALDAHRDDFSALVRDLKSSTNTKGKALFLPLRAALTGETDGPEMAQLIPLLSVERAKRRLQAGITRQA
jgi:glutamyl-tRNA synthetase